MKFLLCCCACYFAVFQNSYMPNPVPKARHQFTVIAHRGDHINYPENTLAAYEQAIKDGADYVEIDLRTTKDGRLISLHNESVDRMTNGTGRVKDLTLEAIKKLRVKVVNQSQKTTYSIPGFEEILTLCKNKIYIYIDFKDADPAVVFAMLKHYGMENQVLVYINKSEQLITWRKVAPQIPLMLSLPDEVKDSTAMIKFADLNRPDLLDGNYEQYTPQLTIAAKSHNLPAWPDAQSQAEGPEVWAKAIRNGLPGLQTDHPQELINFLKKQKLR